MVLWGFWLCFVFELLSLKSLSLFTLCAFVISLTQDDVQRLPCYYFS